MTKVRNVYTATYAAIQSQWDEVFKMDKRDGIGGTNGVQNYPHTGKYFHIDGRIRHCTGHHNTKGYQLFAVDPHGLRTADEVIYRANLDDEQEMALDTNFVPSKDGIPVPKKTKVHLMDCPKCKRVVDIGPTTKDVCEQQPCGIVFNIQKPNPETGASGQAGSMRGRMAQALAEHACAKAEMLPVWPRLGDAEHKFYREQVDAALDTLATPTAGMVAALEACLFEHMPEARDWTVTMAREGLTAAMRAAKAGK